MNDEPNIEPVDLSPTRDELIARVRARGRQIRARRRSAMSALAALIVVAIAVPALALGSRSTPHTIPTATSAGRHGDFRAAIVLSVVQTPSPVTSPETLSGERSLALVARTCIRSVDGKLCYVVGRILVTAPDVLDGRVESDSSQGWVVELTLTRAAARRLVAPVGHQVALIVANRVISAPTVEPGITGTHIQISPAGSNRAQATALLAKILGPAPTKSPSHPPAVTARIELPGDHTYVAGDRVNGTLVVDNASGEWWQAPQAGGCAVPWSVELTKAGSSTFIPPASGAICTQELRQWKGVVRFPFVMRTTAGDCASAPVAASCVPGPPLAPGHYTAEFVAAGSGWPKPHSVAVTLVAAQP